VLHGSYDTHRVNHSAEFVSDDGASTNGAVSYFARLRRGEIGHHHHIAGPYLAAFCPRVRVARKPSPPAERHIVKPRRPRGPRTSEIGAMVRLLATELRMTDYVLTGLVKRRAELAGEIEATHDRLRKMIEDLEKLDSVILQFDPLHQVEAIKPKAFRPPSDWSHRGEMTKTVLSILRQATEPMTTRDIALEMLVTRALDKDDQKLLASMTKRVGVALRLQRLNAIVRSSSGPGQLMLWEIAR
jgi:ISXO2-like transposase domain